MNSEIVKLKVSKCDSFPALAKSKENLVVLFTDRSTGVVLFDPIGGHKLGEFSSSWVNIDDVNVWTKLDEITITFK